MMMMMIIIDRHGICLHMYADDSQDCVTTLDNDNPATQIMWLGTC